jgi:glycine cleavage system aminomethyltransferase T
MSEDAIIMGSAGVWPTKSGEFSAYVMNLTERRKEVGSVSSTTWSPLAGKYLSLALVHRSATEDGTAVTIGPLTGEVTTLPIQDG